MHMAINLLANERSALQEYPVNYCCSLTDSSFVLYWLKTKDWYKGFVKNRALKINEKNYIEVKYIPTQQNTVNIGIRV